MKDKQKRKKERTWAEAARMVLENFSDAPMTPKQILHVIQTKGLKEMRSDTHIPGTAPLACLVTMLHSQVRGDRVKNSIFFKLPGRMSLFTLKKNALQWTKTTESETPSELVSSAATPTSSNTSLTENAAVGATETTEQESSNSTETTASTLASADETSSSVTGSTEVQSTNQPQTRLSRAAGLQGRTDTQQVQHVQHTQTRLSRSRQSGRQRKKAVMMPRVVLTPLKVNGEHVPSGPMKRSRGGVDVDFETPGSILVNTNIRALINVRTFSAFPAQSQQQLLQLLPEVDRQIGPDGMARLSSSALNNEFFTHASQSWKERLAEGEFTHEMQVRFRQEMEKEKKVEAWKEKFFEEYHGQKSGLTREESLKLTMADASEVATSVLDTDSVSVVSTGAPKRRSVGRRRRDGRMRRRTRADLRRRARRTLCKTSSPVLQSAEAVEEVASLETSTVSIGSPMSESTVIQGEVVLQAECDEEVPPDDISIEPKTPTPEPVLLPAPTPTPIPSPESTSDDKEPNISGCLLTEEVTPVLASTSSPSSSSSSDSSPSSSPSSASDQQGAFTTGLDSSSSSSVSSGAAVTTDHLDDTASVVTSVTGGTATSSRESSPSDSPAGTPAPSVQHKEQKRRPDEARAFSSFPEKRPRLNDQQSFRTTIDRVHSEKPQPTTEEPKVPPIRIQLSRIKPPWIKGHPTYQICPRIVPPGEASRRSGTGGARTLADIKARAQQARAQREAAAAVAASAEGPGPNRVRLRPAAGLPDCNSGQRAQEHPGPIEPGGGSGRRGGGGGTQEQGKSCETDSSGTQLQHPNVESKTLPSPSPPATSTSALSENPQTSSPPQKSEEDMNAASASVHTSSNRPAGQATDPPSQETDTTYITSSPDRQSKIAVCPTSTSERLNQAREKRPLAPTSIPDSLPRFGAQGVVVQKLVRSTTPGEREQQTNVSLGGVIQHASRHEDSHDTDNDLATQRADASPRAESSGRDDEAGTHSDSTETASDCENESTVDEQLPDPDWCSPMRGHRKMQEAVCSPTRNRQPVIRGNDPSCHGQTVIQPCFPNGTPHSAQTLPFSQDRHNVVVKVEPVEDRQSSKQGSLDEDPNGRIKPSTYPSSVSGASKKLCASTRPVSSVEANNPLVTQLLQGSLPLDKVLPTHSADRLEISRSAGPHRRPYNRAEASEGTVASQKSYPVSCLVETPNTSQYQSQQASGAVPVITSSPFPTTSPSSSNHCLETAISKESSVHQPSQGPVPDRNQAANRTILNGPSPPHADPCPAEGVPSLKINWRPPQSQIPIPSQQEPAPVPSVKTEVGSKPSCQALAKTSVVVTKKEPVNSMDGYPSGGAMEGLLNMEMNLSRMAKNELSKAPYSSSYHSPPTSLPFQLYGKISKKGGGLGGVSYTANVSVMDNTSFSRNMADGVLQLRPRLASSQATLSIQTFTDSTAEEVSLKCSCRLKAMIMCQGCGAFCHDDCIGPSKLCVSCLVVR
ncbi:putative Polycomb group protein ASXL1 [Corythoichthys intestinalis]|uniref:putative Polycomb group protein ASXL1 n=1 Tax=Corythoichthys intestinalis TaxID=161448 RepID=UPI0025A68BFE|nr:putative Polycomb group protein ASXL1 [Corythoichthys intestinalis]XP_061803295.1 putative Polycomb group protein ASXL1 isoform X2 [Nerophis lumbriciformis]